MVSTRRRTKARAAATTSGNKPCIDKLNDELLLHIFEILKFNSKPDLLAATVVCSEWHTLAQRVIDSHIGPITISTKMEDRNIKLFGRMRRDAGFRQRILHLSIGEWFLVDMEMHESEIVPSVGVGESPYRATGYFSDSWSEITRQKDATWRQLARLIDVVKNLRLLNFFWKATPSLPHELAEALASNQQCSILIGQSELAIEYTKLCYAPYANQWSLQGLDMISKNLTSLVFLVPAADGEMLREIGQLVWSSAALRELRVNAIGCMWTSDVVPYALRQTEFGKLTTVTDLKWLCRPDAQGTTDILRLATLELSNMCACKDALGQAWIESVDWNRLESLTLSCMSLLGAVRGRVERLTSLQFTVPSDRNCEHITCTSRTPPEHVATVLQSFSELRHLKIINGTDCITPLLLETIGDRLCSLAVHDRTQARWESGLIRPLLESSVIQRIGACCQNLLHLAVDVPYSDMPYKRFLDKLAHSVPYITSLAVYREVEVPGTDVANPPRSAVTLLSVESDCAQLRQTMSHLVKFDMRVTSMPPFYLDKRRHERANGLTFYQRHLSVELARAVNGFQHRALQARSIDVERAAEAVSHAAHGPILRHWESEVPWHEHVASHAYDFYWKPPQPY